MTDGEKLKFQWQKMLRLLENKDVVTASDCLRAGIRNPRQQAYFLKQKGYDVINNRKRYKLI